MNSKPLISIVICTYNNADSLLITLDQILRQCLTDLSLVEIIVVDNNSPDHSASVVQSAIKVSPIVMKYFFEGRQGLSYARNTGVEAAAGTYILFTDDDAEIPPAWVDEYIKKIRDVEPDCLYSKIDIVWDKPIPWWYTNRYRPYFVGLDYGEMSLNVTDNSKEFFGKNFCIKRDLIISMGGFDPALGRSGSKLIAGEETLLYRKLVEQKKKVLYFPSAPVGHRLKEREYLEENIKKQFIDSAYSNYHIAKLISRKQFLGRPLGVLLTSLKMLLVSLILMPVSWILNNKQELFFHSISLSRSVVLLKLWIIAK